MTLPTAPVVTTNLDAGTDSPASARTDLLDAVTKLNQIIGHTSSFAATLLDDADAPAARATLGVAPRATRIDVASASTVNLTTSAPDTDDIRITGTTTITAVTVVAGRVVRVTASAAHTLTNSASIVTQTGANIVCAAGDTYVLRATAADVVEVMFYTQPSATVSNGTWTLGLDAYGGGGDPGFITATSSGVWARSGKQVTVHFELYIDAFSGYGGAAVIGSTLPAPVSGCLFMGALSWGGATGNVSYGAVRGTASGSNLLLELVGNTTPGTTLSALTTTQFGAGVTLRGTLSYITNAA